MLIGLIYKKRYLARNKDDYEMIFVEKFMNIINNLINFFWIVELYFIYCFFSISIYKKREVIEI